MRTGEDRAAFDWVGVLAGLRRTLPVALGVFTYGLVFGVLAGETALTPAETLLMSALVFAGSAQFVALPLWHAPLPTLALVLTTLVVNLRHLLMGAALAPAFRRLNPLAAYGTLFFLVDECWALTMAEFARGQRSAGFLLGSGLAVYAAWVAATVAGRLLGGALREPARWLDFAFTAVFLAILAGLWRGRRDLIPWAAAALVAIAAERWLPGTWHILLGGLAGSLVAAVRRGR